MNNLGATEEEKREAQTNTPTVEVKDNRGTNSILLSSVSELLTSEQAVTAKM